MEMRQTADERRCRREGIVYYEGCWGQSNTGLGTPWPMTPDLSP